MGTHLSNYQDGDLILIGSYLPHTGFTRGLAENQKEIVIQFKPNFFETAFENLEELKRINQLLELSKKGIVFEGPIKEDIGLRMEGLQYETQIDAFLTFVKILHDLAKRNTKEFSTQRAMPLLVVQQRIKDLRLFLTTSEIILWSPLP